MYGYFMSSRKIKFKILFRKIYFNTHFLCYGNCVPKIFEIFVSKLSFRKFCFKNYSENVISKIVKV